MTILDRTEASVGSATYDLAVIGAGINGAAIARDAATRGLSVIVVEADDIGSGTSAWSSRLIHGGLRYLEHGELRLVHESLHDRECLLKIAPHLVQPLPFVVPVYRHNHKPGWMFWAGMFLYDGLSMRKSVPRHRRLNRKAVALELPGLEKSGLSAALRYYDGQVPYAERLVLETLLSAVEAGADVLTYTRVRRILVEGGNAVGVLAHDEITGAEREIRAASVVNAAGPWLDEAHAGLGLERMIGGTKGTHLIVDPFPGAPDVAVYYEARSDNRPVLVIPWNGRYLIGTTDDPFDGEPGAARGTTEELDYLLAETNSLIPQAGLTRDSVLYTYSGIRPLPYRPGVKPGKIPRSHLIVSSPEIGRLLSVVGGKLTPHLSLGTETVDLVAKSLGRSLPPSRTAKEPLPGARGWTSAQARRRDLSDYDDATVDRLVAVYGGRCSELTALIAEDPALGEIVGGNGRGAVIAAEIVLAVRREGAVHLADILHRRTMVGLEPTLGLDVDESVAAFAAPLLGWTAEDVDREIAAHRTYVSDRLLGGVERAVPALR